MVAVTLSVTLKEQLNRLLASLYDEGVLDRQFDELRRTQNNGNPGFIVDVLTMFCTESEILFGLIDQLVEKPDMGLMDYRRIHAHVLQLKGSCASVGGRRVKTHCEEFHRCFLKKDIIGSFWALNGIKQESCRLQINFQTIIQLEKKILAGNTA